MKHERITAPPAPDNAAPPPLVIDLDRTLVTNDVAMEQLVRFGRRSWRTALALLWALALSVLHGPARLKVRLAKAVPIDAATLPYRPEVLELIATARAQHRPVILATASHARVAHAVARHLGLFDAVIATRGRRNAKGAAKLAAIQSEIAAMGATAFDYVGDSRADRPIWRAARTAYTVGVATHTAAESRLARPRGLGRALLKAVRPHQWAKNALVFVPLATSGLVANPGSVARSVAAFACLSLIASSVYLLNDLLDIDADRLHPKKCRRPIAAGDLPIPHAFAASLLFAAVGLGASLALLGKLAALTMAAYFALTLAYSFRLKSAMIADVLALACLYAIRIVAGAAAIYVPVSSWLLLFSLFVFLSLGYLKRYIELCASTRPYHRLLSGRGYAPGDAEVVAMSGISAGMVSVLVLVLFAEAMGRSATYATPQLLWLLPLPLLYWLNRIWMMGKRGQVDSDPVAFAITDRKSIAVGVAMGAIVMAAKFAPWGAVMARISG